MLPQPALSESTPRKSAAVTGQCPQAASADTQPENERRTDVRTWPHEPLATVVTKLPTHLGLSTQHRFQG